jgi:hypothetical protein
MGPARDERPPLQPWRRIRFGRPISIYVMIVFQRAGQIRPGSGSVSSGSRADSVPPLPWNRWSHLAAVKRRGGRARLCQRRGSTAPASSPVLSESAPLDDRRHLPCRVRTSGAFSSAAHDVIQIWRTALNASEIADWRYRAPDQAIVPVDSCRVTRGRRSAARGTTSREGPRAGRFLRPGWFPCVG